MRRYQIATIVPYVPKDFADPSSMVEYLIYIDQRGVTKAERCQECYDKCLAARLCQAAVFVQKGTYLLTEGTLPCSSLSGEVCVRHVKRRY